MKSAFMCKYRLSQILRKRTLLTFLINKSSLPWNTKNAYIFLFQKKKQKEQIQNLNHPSGLGTPQKRPSKRDKEMKTKENTRDISRELRYGSGHAYGASRIATFRTMEMENSR